LKSITASLDGPPIIQNQQRPLQNGMPSFDIVKKVLNAFDKVGFKYAIRSTITGASVDYIEEIVDFFCREFKPQSIHLEPLAICGRCNDSGSNSADFMIFLQKFINAMDIARQNNIILYYSGARLDALSSTFCGASRDHFVVLPDGNVTACNEVCRPDDLRKEFFYYGYYEIKSNQFIFNKDKINKLHSRRVENIPFCSNCFLKWHCSGDCPAKIALTSGSPFEPLWSRCQLNHGIAAEYMYRLLNQKNDFKDQQIIRIIN